MSSETAVNNKERPSAAKPLKKSRSLSETGVCDLCCEKPKTYAVGQCDHPVCFTCSARMRVLSNQMYCPSCRADMEQVVFCKVLQKFSTFPLQKLPGNRKYGIRFEEKSLQREFRRLLDKVCTICNENNEDNVFTSLSDLKSHVRKIHERQFCDICIENLTLFPRELKTYTKKDLVKHRKCGDSDEKSHRGHPECRFCDDRYFDNDQLLTHLRKTHFWCHFCEGDGKQDYYDVYEDLRKHFRNEHYLCDEGNCVDEKFTSVFKDKIDYQAHKLAYHANKMNKIQAKEARIVDIDYRYHGRRPQTLGQVTGLDYEEAQRDEKKNNNGARGGGRQRRMDYNEYENVEQERKKINMKKKKENNKKGVGNEMNSDQSPNQSPEETEAPQQRRRVMDDDDDGVIGMTEHINRDESEDRNDKKTPSPMPEEPEKVSREPTPPPTPPQVVRQEEDFPTLPGASHVPFNNMASRKQTHNEAFPALGNATKKANKHASLVLKPKKDTKPATIPVTVKKQLKNKKGGGQLPPGLKAKQVVEDDLPSEDFPSLSAYDKIPARFKDVAPPLSYKTTSQNQSNISLITSKDPTVAEAQHQVKKKTVISVVTNKSAAKSKAPPPGFKKQQASAPKQAGPPGLKKSQNPQEQAQNNPDVEAKRKMERNANLLAMLKTLLDDFNMGVFKNLSGEFRRGNMAATVYYDGIKELLGGNLKSIFSELVALLPDEKKQNELLAVHNNAKVSAKQQPQKKPQPSADYSRRDVWGAGPANVAEPKTAESKCPECEGKFPQDEINVHIESHQNSFPALPVAVKKKKDYGFMPSKRQYVPLNSAWGK